MRIEVHDANGNTDGAFRGLLLADALTGSRWGVSERDGVGKRGWAVVTTNDLTAPSAPEVLGDERPGGS
ncbi:hypothetical protein [Streptomyces sp. IBSBF 2435]|uniref:hypothetical protein n=1 Tax=Streptomyces sp. IBSBF 2435 TaxID=2903531 RepID=UPI002FDBFC2A